MPIYAPGRRDRRNKPHAKKGRNVVAMLSLTAMVDMFTVLAVFLLQNYQTTGEVIDVSDQVELPMASSVKDLQPAHVIVLSKQNLMVDQDALMTADQVKAQSEWKIEPLLARLQAEFQKAEAARQSGLQAIKADDPEQRKKLEENERRITVQVDKTVDMLSVKKVMFTITEAGASEVNFAVIKDETAKVK